MLLSATGLALTEPVVAAFGPSTAVSAAATTYLRWAWLGLTPMLLILATTGVLRGLLDTRTPLYVAVAANLLNIGLNVWLVHGTRLGVAGSAIGTDLAQLAAAAALTVVVLRATAAEGVSVRPDLRGLRLAARAGGPLLVRTLSLQACLIVMTWVAAGLGTLATATHQLAMAVWTFLAHALDAVAIAAQALTGTALGAADVEGTRATTARLVRLGLKAGVATGVLLALSAPVLGPAFTDDPAVVEQLGDVLLVAALFQPVAGVVFVLDGVLIGAGDGRYLAAAGTAVTAAFVPVAVLLSTALPPSGAGLVWAWAAFGAVFIGGRAVTLLARARGTAWLRTGAGATGRAGP